MFFEKYLNSTYISLLYNNYNIDYLNSFDEKNFDYIYNLLKNYNFYYIEDIIVNYIELFEFDYEAVNYAILNIKSELGEDFVKIIGNNLTIINDIIEKATDY